MNRYLSDTLALIALAGSMVLLLMSAWAAPASCHLIGSELSGRYRVCHYSCLGGNVSTTVLATRLCPLSTQDGR